MGFFEGDVAKSTLISVLDPSKTGSGSLRTVLNYYGLVDVRGEGRRTVGFWLRPWRGSHPGLAPFVVGDSSEWMPGRRRKGFRVAADCRPWRATLA